MPDKPTYDENMSLILKVLIGEATDEERRDFETWVSDPEHQQLYEEYRIIWEQSAEAEGIDQAAVEDAWQQVQQVIGPETRSGRRWFMYAAASIVVLLAAAALFLFLPRNQVQRSQTALQTVTLPDGSTVTLNAFSQVSFPKHFSGKDRRIRFEGEGFFEIKHDTLHPFVIETGGGQVTVLGTSFNVDAYRDSKEVTVTVTTGKVKLSSSKGAAMLNPGQSGTLIKATGEVMKNEQADRNYLAWKTGELVFEDRNLGEVVRILEHVYRKKIQFSNPRIAQCTITVSFHGQSLEEVLRVIASTLDLQLKTTGEGYELQGDGC